MKSQIRLRAKKTNKVNVAPKNKPKISAPKKPKAKKNFFRFLFLLLLLFVPSDEDDERVFFFTYLLCGVVDWEMKHRPQIIHGLDVLYCYLRAILD